MAWSYDGDPSASNKDAVRWLVGDTDPARKLVSDEEVAYALGDVSNVHAAAALVADAIAAQFSRDSDRQVGDLKISASQKSKQYRQTARMLRRKASLAVSPFVGGTSVSDKNSRRDDSDRPQEAFFVGQWDNPRAIQPGYNSTST